VDFFERALLAFWLAMGALVVISGFVKDIRDSKKVKMAKVKTLLLEDHPHECAICDATYHELLDLMAHLKEYHNV